MLLYSYSRLHGLSTWAEQADLIRDLLLLGFDSSDLLLAPLSTSVIEVWSGPVTLQASRSFCSARAQNPQMLWLSKFLCLVFIYASHCFMLLVLRQFQTDFSLLSRPRYYIAEGHRFMFSLAHCSWVFVGHCRSSILPSNLMRILTQPALVASVTPSRRLVALE